MTVSVEPLEAPPAPNLFLDGDFENWWAGSPAPGPNFLLPGPHATITRGFYGSEGRKYVLVQEWEKPDSRWEIGERFKMKFTDLQQNMDYQFSLDALLPEGNEVTLNLAGMKGEDEFYPIDGRILVLAPKEEWQTYSAAFSSGVLHDVVLSTGCFELPEEGLQRLMLDSIRLTEIGETVYPEPAATAANLIVNGSFDIWVNGADLPEGPFSFSSETSTIRRSGFDKAEDHYYFEQTWTADDSTEDPSTAFGVEIEGLQPETDYEFDTRFSVYGKFFLAVSVYGVGEDGGLEAIMRPLISAGGKKVYGAKQVFNTGPYSRIRLISHLPEGTTEFPNLAKWHEWKLRAARK